MDNVIRTYTKGQCSCGSENIQFNDVEPHKLDGDCIIYEFLCNDCGRVVQEIYNVKYCETITWKK